MAFRILDQNGEGIKINDLDKEAAEFWGKEVNDSYMTPRKILPIPVDASEEDKTKLQRINLTRETSGNWFDVIGYQISDPILNRNYHGTDWKKVKANLCAAVFDSSYSVITPDMGDEDKFDELSKNDNEAKEFKTLENRLMGNAYYLAPYLALIDHWDSKGYKPVKIEG